MRMDALLAGAAVAALVRLRPLETLQASARWVLGLTAGLLGIAMLTMDVQFQHPLVAIAGYPLLGLCFGALLVRAMAPGTWSGRFGSWAPLRFLGRYSYGLYFYHVIATPMTLPLLRWLQVRCHSVGLRGIVYAAIMFLLTLLVSILSYELYERHFLRLKRFFPYAPTSA